MNFRVTKKKVIVSVIIVILWYLLLSSMRMNVVCGICYEDHLYHETGEYPECDKVFHVDILPVPEGCSCGCLQATTIKEIVNELLILLFPGILVYVIWSFIQTKEVSKENKVDKNNKKSKKLKKGK